MTELNGKACEILQDSPHDGDRLVVETFTHDSRPFAINQQNLTQVNARAAAKLIDTKVRNMKIVGSLHGSRHTLIVVLVDKKNRLGKCRHTS